jgi:hypothetical protein
LRTGYDRPASHRAGGIVTGSVEELRAALAQVVDHLGTATRYAMRAGALIDDAVAVLAQLSEQHPESLVPAELNRASQDTARSLGLIQGGSMLVGDIEARL